MAPCSHLPSPILLLQYLENKPCCEFGGLSLTIAAFLFLASVVVNAQNHVVRIGFQKYGTLVLLKGRGLLEVKLAALGYNVAWTAFPAGPQLLEALKLNACLRARIGRRVGDLGSFFGCRSVRPQLTNACQWCRLGLKLSISSG
jgi:hypothetical protein